MAELKKVKLLTSWEEAGVGNHEEGAELELEASVADQLIEEGTAEAVAPADDGGDQGNTSNGSQAA